MQELARVRRRSRWLLGACALLVAATGWSWLRRPSSAREPLDLDRDGAVAELKEQLSSAGYAERVRMLHKLGRSGSPKATAAVIELYRSAANDRVRLNAIQELGRLGTREAVAELAEIAQGTRRHLAQRAIRALGQTGSPDAEGKLLELLESEEQRSGRAQVLDALGALGGERAVETLVKLAQDREESARLSAVGALGESGAPSALTVLAQLAADPERKVRERAVAALGSHGSPEAKTALVRLVQEGEASLRPAALEKLNWHKKEGHTIVIVSASFEEYLKFWCKQEGIALLATTIEVKDGKFTGKFASPNCYGDEKIRRIKQTYNLQDFSHITAYGDTKGDLPLKEIAHEFHYKPFL